MGSLAMHPIRDLRASLHVLFHRNLTPFLSRFMIGLAFWAYPEIKAHWYPRTLRICLTCLIFLSSRGQSLIPLILLGSTLTCLFPTWNSRNSISYFSNLHLDSLRK